MLLDRMVNLLTRGCVVPVVKYIKQCCQKDDTDISLIRYFVKEVLSLDRLNYQNIIKSSYSDNILYNLCHIVKHNPVPYI